VPIYDPTIEDLYHKETWVDDELYYLDILDTAGHEEFREMREQYFKTRTGFLLLFALYDKRSFEDVEKLRQQILEVKGTNSFPMVLVGCKADLPERSRQVDTKEASAYAKVNNIPYIETSSMTGQGVDEAFFHLVREMECHRCSQKKNERKCKQKKAKFFSLSPRFEIVDKEGRLSHAKQIGKDVKENRNQCSNEMKGPSWMSQYKMAVKQQGSVSVNIVRCVLVGPPKVGKSCLKHLLVHNEPKEVTTSTPVLESPEIVTITPELYMTKQGSSSVWKPIMSDEMEDLVKKWTMEGDYSDPKVHEIPSNDSKRSANNLRIPKVLKNISKLFSRKASSSSNGKHTPCIHTSAVASSINSTALSSLKLAQSELFGNHQVDCMGTKWDQQKLTLVHILDSGGQLAFHDVLPLLINTPCTYVNVFNASVDLDEPVDITYRAQDGRECKLHHQLSQWDMMLRTFSSAHNMSFKCHEEIKDVLNTGQSPTKSHIAVVGTHKDKLASLPNHEDLKSKIASRLDSTEASRPYSLLRHPKGHPLFLIGSLAMHDEQDLNSLRATLSSEACTMSLDIPLVWLYLELVTRNTEIKFIRYSELKDFCLQSEYISTKGDEDVDVQLRSLLSFLHSLGFYAFYDLEGVCDADNWVCTDAATLYREVSKLLVVQYMEYPTKEATRLFKKTGIIEMRGVQDLFNELDILRMINDSWFLQVLLHIGIAARVMHEGAQYYFLPLALPFNRVSLPCGTSVSRLCVTLVFSHQFGRLHVTEFPRGLFPHVAVQLANCPHQLSCHKKDLWQIVPNHSDRTHIKFDYKESAIYLIESTGHIEVAITLGKPFFSSSMSTEEMKQKVHSFCKDVHSTVLATVESACVQVYGVQFVQQVSLKSGFLCSCGESIRHLAFLDENGTLRCSLQVSRLPKEMSCREKIWISSEESDIKFSLVKDEHDMFWIMKDFTSMPFQNPTQLQVPEYQLFDPKMFMEKYKDKFMDFVPAGVVVYRWEVDHIIDENTREEVSRALPSDATAILFKYIKRNGTLATIRKMCKLLKTTGEDGYPCVKKLAMDMTEELNGYQSSGCH
jgi:small GTP-binding protein